MKPSLKLKFLLISIFMMANLEWANANQCLKEFGKPLFATVKMGNEVSAEDLPFAVADGSRVYFLGEGLAGGMVFRVVEPDGKTQVYKDYVSSFKAAKDFEKLEILYRLSQEPGYKGLAVVKPITRFGAVVVLENIYGRTLLELLKKPDSENSRLVSEKISKELKADYETRLEETFKAIKRVIPSSKRDPDHKNVVNFTNKADNQDMFFLHEDNVVVTPEGQLTIIDPY